MLDYRGLPVQSLCFLKECLWGGGGGGLGTRAGERLLTKRIKTVLKSCPIVHMFSHTVHVFGVV